MVPAAVVDLSEERPAASPGWVAEPWPGQIPAPSPARIHPDPLTANVLDEQGNTVGVSARGELTGAPHRVLMPGTSNGTAARRIVQWAGPWTAEQRWWDPLTRRRRARMQVVLDDNTAHLLALERQHWAVEASYD